MKATTPSQVAVQEGEAARQMRGEVERERHPAEEGKKTSVDGGERVGETGEKG